MTIEGKVATVTADGATITSPSPAEAAQIQKDILDNEILNHIRMRDAELREVDFSLPDPEQSLNMLLEMGFDGWKYELLRLRAEALTKKKQIMAKYGSI